MLLTNCDFAVRLLAAVLLPAGVLVIIVLITVVTCFACKRSRKKKKKKEKEEEEDMDVDDNPVYRTYELVENYERQYSINEVIDYNPDYA